MRGRSVNYKSRRLCETRSFNDVFNAAAPKIVESKLILLAKSNELGHPRLGLAISKRHVKLACQRNRVKRVIRASFNQRDDLPSSDIVILSRSGLRADNKELLWSQLESLWTQLIVYSRG